MEAIDIHQHLWTGKVLERLRERSESPSVRGRTLHLDAQPPHDIAPLDHDIAARIAADRESEVGTACVSLSSPVGIEALPQAEARDLIEAWTREALLLPGHFLVWASVPAVEPDPADLVGLLAHPKVVGLQLPASQLQGPAAWERQGPLLAAAESAGKAVLVHPGAAAPDPGSFGRGTAPAWWSPVVDYSAQMTASWWGWHAAGGRELFPSLRLVFAAGAGLAPLQHERYARRRGTSRGRSWRVDPEVYVETSGYADRALDALIRVLGIDQLVVGSDRPNDAALTATELTGQLGAAAAHALRVTNPHRLLAGSLGGESRWAAAS